MTIFKDHKVNVEDLLSVIPEALMVHLSQTTSVDYYSKVLHGKKMFYLLLYGILENDRLSQRSLEDTFNNPVFKRLFALDTQERVRRSSISERLGKIDPDYFRQIYEHLYSLFLEHYSQAEQNRYHIIRVDSTLITDTTGRLMEGLVCKNRIDRKGRKAVKYSMAFDGLLPCAAEVFTDPVYTSEDKALPPVIAQHLKPQAGHRNLYVLDRGLRSSKNMKDFNRQNIVFIARVHENRKYVELESLLDEQASTDLGELTLVADKKVYLYAGQSVYDKHGHAYIKQMPLEEPFRLVVAKNKDATNEQYWFVTNDFELSAKEICDHYRRRWDIEVFFRFLKQELNTSHLVSLNANGIQVMLYMTLIVAMLVLIYKRANNIGYKTAKRRLTMELRNLMIAMIVVHCGGDPTLFFKIKKE